MQKTVDFSIVIPALNEEKFLPAALESLARQRFDGTYEVIVVDNNSTDATAEVARAYGTRVVTESVRGICHARQAGAAVAKGNVIISTDADCIFPSDWLTQYRRAFANDQTVAAFGPYEFTPVPKWGRAYSRLLFAAVRYFYNRNGSVVYVGASNFAFLRSALEHIGGYNLDLAQGGDEYGLLKRLKPLGPVRFVDRNTVITSSRRLKRGLLYSLLISLFLYYIVDYVIATFFIGRSFFGSSPAYRDVEYKKTKRVKILSGFGYTIIALLLIFILPNISSSEAKAKVRVVNATKKISHTVTTTVQKALPNRRGKAKQHPAVIREQ